MIRLLVRLKNLLVRLLEWVLILLTAGLVLDVIWQVATRYLLNHPSSWTDELATLLIIWVALLGASVAFIKEGHLGIDFLVQRLPPARQRFVQILVYLLIGFFAAVILVWGGIKLVELTLVTQQVSPALGVKMGYVYLALPISGFFILLFSAEAALERVFGRAEKGGQ